MSTMNYHNQRLLEAFIPKLLKAPNVTFIDTINIMMGLYKTKLLFNTILDLCIPR